jgi:carbonyl reductase 1
MTSNDDAASVAFVTGANQGLGLSLVRALCRQLGDGGVVYLAARDAERGQRAVRQLRGEGLAPVFHQLDVRDGDQVSEAAETLRGRHGGVDIVVSNAALRRTRDSSDAETIRAFIDTNNLGAHRMIHAFGPILNDDARFIVVASAFGRLPYLSEELRPRFDPATMTLEDLEKVLDEYAALVEAGQDQAAGWPASINVASKIGQVAAVRVMARDYADEARRRGILINAACPGLVDTEASRPWFDDMSAAQSPDAAAVDVAWLATLPAGATEPYGELVQHRVVLGYGAHYRYRLEPRSVRPSAFGLLNDLVTWAGWNRAPAGSRRRRR